MTKMCSRCKQRVAVVFVTRMEGNKTINEGLCLKCAKELGVKPVTDIIEKMGINEEDLDAMMDEVNSLMPMDDEDGENGEDSGRAPAINFGALFPNMGGNKNQNANGEKKPEDKKKSERKHLSQFCQDLTAKA